MLELSFDNAILWLIDSKRNDLGKRDFVNKVYCSVCESVRIDIRSWIEGIMILTQLFQRLKEEQNVKVDI